MKLKDYIKQLNEIAKKYPNLTVITSSDDEGNSFHEVVYSPAVGRFTGRCEFEPFDGDAASPKPNAVCLN